jgi:hypothetical protein
MGMPCHSADSPEDSAVAASVGAVFSVGGADDSDSVGAGEVHAVAMRPIAKSTEAKLIFVFILVSLINGFNRLFFVRELQEPAKKIMRKKVANLRKFNFLLLIGISCYFLLLKCRSSLGNN